jgi:NitT/TauT family transport system permease protein
MPPDAPALYAPARAGTAPDAVPLRDDAFAAAARRRRRLIRVLPWLVFAALLLLWEAAVAVFAVPQFALPAPSAIVLSLGKWWTPILANALQTLETTLLGFAIANVAGVILGVVIGSSFLAYHGLFPLLIAFNSIPKVAVVPILVIWCGLGSVPAIITSFLISFFPIAVNVAAGIATVEPELRDVLRALGASPLTIVRKIGLPRSMPFYFASLKVAITSSFLGSILAETVAGEMGIGHLMIVASSRFEVPLMFAGLIVIAMLSVTMYALATLIERRTIAWATRSQTGLAGGQG